MADLRPFVTSALPAPPEGTRPSFYLYQQTEHGRVQLGLVGLASVAAYEAFAIRPHELTQQDRELDRARYLQAVGGHDEPVLLTYRARPALDRQLAAALQGPPLFEEVGADGVRHALWRVAPETGVWIEEAFREVEALYIADGHHRLAAAATLRAQRGAEGSGPEDWFLAMLVPHDQLHILPFHRGVRDLHGHTPQTLQRRLEEAFSLTPEPDGPAPGPRRVSMLLEGKWWGLALRPEAGDGSLARRLDVSLLQDQVLGPLLGVGDPRVDPRLDFLGRPTALADLERRVGAGELAVGFALHPTSVAEVLAVADAGETMPPQSTCFEPKPKPGLLVYRFEAHRFDASTLRRAQDGWRRPA